MFVFMPNIMKNLHSILIVGNFLSATSGSRGVCEDFAEHLSNANWTVFTTSNKPGRIARLLDMLFTVWSRRNQFKIATIDTFSGPSFFWAEVIGFTLRKLGKPFVLILHGGDLPNFSRRHQQRVIRLFKSAAAITVPSKYLLEQMQPYCSDILLLPNPIDIQKYKFISRHDPRPVLIWLRAFHSIYNAPLAIYTLGLLVSDNHNFRLLMGGNDKGDGSFQKVKQLVETLGISSKIEFAGKISKANVPSWLQNGDIFINTTNVDNTPISVLEAMACGLCVISTNVGGIPYLLEDGKDAFLVDPNNPEAMASAVRRILTEPNLAEKLSMNARKKAEQVDWSVILPQWESLLEGILNV